MSAESDDDLYSDDAHSGSAMEEEAQEQDVISPTDGYFRGTADAEQDSPAQSQPRSAHRPTHETPHVPDVLVEDPTLQQPSSAKEAEARQEAENANDVGTQSQVEDGPRSPSHSTLNTTVDAALSQRSSVQPSTQSQPVSPRIGRYPSSNTNVNPTFQHTRTLTWHSTPAAPRDAPPAYTSSRPAASDYQTFDRTHSVPSPTAVSPTTDHDESDQEAHETTALLPHIARQVNNIENDEHEDDAISVHSRASTKLPVRMRTCLTILISCLLSSLITSSFFIYAQLPKTQYIDAEPIREVPAKDFTPLTWKPIDGCRNTPHSVSHAGYPVRTSNRKALTIYESIPIRIGTQAEGTLTTLHNTLQNKTTVDGNDTPVTTFGNIYIKPWREGKYPRVIVEGVGNDASLGHHTELGTGMSSSQLFMIRFPDRIAGWTDANLLPCYQAQIIVLVPPGSVMRDFSIAGQYFDIHVEDGVDLSVSGTVSLASAFGSVFSSKVSHGMKNDLAPFRIQAVQWLVASVAGRVSGWFPLYDGLSIEAASSISVQLGLKQPSTSPAESAAMAIASKHGNINLTTPLIDMDEHDPRKTTMPMRDYSMTIAPEYGNVDASIPIGSSTIVECLEGTLNMTLQPILSKDSRSSSWKSRLITETSSGNTMVRVSEPIWTNKIKRPYLSSLSAMGTSAMSATLSNSVPWLDGSLHSLAKQPLWNTFESSHVSTVGDLKLIYPDSWAGRILWQADVPDFNIGGDDIEIIRQGESTQMYIEARRRNGYSSLSASTSSGTTSIAIGKELEDVEQFVRHTGSE